MEQKLSRRATLRSLGAVAGVAALDWGRIARASYDAQQAAQAGAPLEYTLLGAADAADVRRSPRRSCPDETPGAREAGASLFIDRTGLVLCAPAPGIHGGPRPVQGAARAAYPQSPPSRRSVRPADCIPAHRGHHAVLRPARQLTMCGMFTNPPYGGNRDKLGWKLIGFEDQHVFEPPFGYYDTPGNEGMP
jgi:hypothetical protein